MSPQENPRPQELWEDEDYGLLVTYEDPNNTELGLLCMYVDDESTSFFHPERCVFKMRFDTVFAGFREGETAEVCKWVRENIPLLNHVYQQDRTNQT